MIAMFKKDSRLIEIDAEPPVDDVFNQIEKVFIEKKLDKWKKIML